MLFRKRSDVCCPAGFDADASGRDFGEPDPLITLQPDATPKLTDNKAASIDLALHRWSEPFTSPYTSAAIHSRRRTPPPTKMVQVSQLATPRPSARFIKIDADEAISGDTEQFCSKVNDRFKVKVRRWQAQAIQAVLEGRDVVVRAGTGSGKSLIFQALTLWRPGATVLVIVPTLAIMQNQV
jgi:ATP-dependent helicase YprA (DUF1998 family)